MQTARTPCEALSTMATATITNATVAVSSLDCVVLLDGALEAVRLDDVVLLLAEAPCSASNSSGSVMLSRIYSQ